MSNDNPRERAYDEHFQPILNKLIALAREHDIAFIFSARLDEHDEGRTMRCHTIVPHRAPDGIEKGETPEEFARALLQIRTPVDRACIAMLHAEVAADGPAAVQRIMRAVSDD